MKEVTLSGAGPQRPKSLPRKGLRVSHVQFKCIECNRKPRSHYNYPRLLIVHVFPIYCAGRRLRY